MPSPRTERELLQHLQAMQAALAEMEPALPEDVRPLGVEARRKAEVWLVRVARREAELEALSLAMAELAAIMDSLTARLLLSRWDRPAPARS